MSEHTGTKYGVTKFMKEFLMECHEREMMNLPPVDIGNARHSKGLLTRKLLVAKKYTTSNGMELMCVFITQSGRDYLTYIND